MSKDFRELVTVADPDDTVSEVITRMAAGGTKYFGISLIVGPQDQLLGVFNDGDVLRLIAGGGELDKPVSEVMVRHPVVAREGMTDSQVLDEVRNQLARRHEGRKDIVRFIPVLSSEGVVLDVLDMYAILARSPRQGETVVVYGLGFVGLTLAASLATHGHRVTGIDTNVSLVESLNDGKPHVFEPRLPEMIRQGLASGSLAFRTQTEDEHHHVSIIAVGTPLEQEGRPSTRALEEVCRAVGPGVRRGDMVMVRSTVPVGTTRSLVIPVLEELSGLSVGRGFHVAFAPERTVEGNAIRELTQLPQIVAGATDSCYEKASGFWSTLTDTVVRLDSLEAAELAKLINNSYRDLSFAFANGLALLADKYNIDANRLIAAANEGYPRNLIPRPSPGVGGYCLTKDPYLYAASEIGAGHGDLARLGRQINDNSGRYPLTVLERYLRRTGHKPEAMKVLLVGMAFKGLPETNDIRGSTAVGVAKALEAYGCATECFDAVVTPEELEANGLKPAPLLDAAGNADAIFILNNHPQNAPDGFFDRLAGRAVLLFDGWNLLERHEVEKYPGITYATLGYMTPATHNAFQ